jgi:hypothetical protein
MPVFVLWLWLDKIIFKPEHREAEAISSTGTIQLGTEVTKLSSRVHEHDRTPP